MTMIEAIKNSTIALLAAMTLLFAGMFAVMNVPVAAACAEGAPPACQACEGAGGSYSSSGCAAGESGATSLFEGSDSIFESVINILTFVVGAIAVIMLIIGGLRYVLSNGDANAVGSAKNTILYSIIGLVVVFAARAIILFVVDNVG